MATAMTFTIALRQLSTVGGQLTPYQEEADSERESSYMAVHHGVGSDLHVEAQAARVWASNPGVPSLTHEYLRDWSRGARQ